VFWKVIILCSEIIQKHKISLGDIGVCSNWFYLIGSKKFHLLEQTYIQFVVAGPPSMVIEPQNYYSFPVIVALDSTAEILLQAGV